MPDETIVNGKEWTEPAKSEDIELAVRILHTYMGMIIAAFEHRYGVDTLISGEFIADEERFFSSANLLSQTLLNASRWLRSDFKGGELVLPDPFLKFSLGIALACFEEFKTLPWVNITSNPKDGTMGMKIDPIEASGLKDQKSN